jgi:hypothetical protein
MIKMQDRWRFINDFMGFDGDKYRDLPCPTNMGISIGITLC